MLLRVSVGCLYVDSQGYPQTCHLRCYNSPPTGLQEAHQLAYAAFYLVGFAYQHSAYHKIVRSGSRGGSEARCRT